MKGTRAVRVGGRTMRLVDLNSPGTIGGCVTQAVSSSGKSKRSLNYQI